MDSQAELDKNNFPTYQRGERSITVVLRKDYRVEKQNFRCNNCGKLLFQYQNPLKLIFDGRVEDGERPVEVICQNCKIIYMVD
jgi:hypothetical protein